MFVGVDVVDNGCRGWLILNFFLNDDKVHLTYFSLIFETVCGSGAYCLVRMSGHEAPRIFVTTPYMGPCLAPFPSPCLTFFLFLRGY